MTQVVQPPPAYHNSDDTALLIQQESDDNADLVHTIQFDENQVYVEIINFFGLAMLIIICTLGLGLPMLIFAFVPYFRFYYIFKRRQCYVTGTNIVLKQEEPNLCGCCWPSRSELFVPLSAVVNVSLTQSFVQRWFDTWTINIQTPGQGVVTQTADGGNGSMGQHFMQLLGVREPQLIRKTILDLSAKAKGNSNNNASSSDKVYKHPAQPVMTQETAVAITDIRDMLKEIKTAMAKQ